MGSGGHVREQQLHVPGPDFLAVDPVGRAGIPFDPAGNFQFVGIVELRRRLTVGIVQMQDDFGDIAGRTRRRSAEYLPPPRRLLAEVSPITQRNASTTLDLPQPFGPTTPVIPGSIRSSTGSTKDLKPETRSFVKCTELRPDYLDGRAERIISRRLPGFP
jgi:hypothetical protein